MATKSSTKRKTSRRGRKPATPKKEIAQPEVLSIESENIKNEIKTLINQMGSLQDRIGIISRTYLNTIGEDPQEWSLNTKTLNFEERIMDEPDEE